MTKFRTAYNDVPKQKPFKKASTVDVTVPKDCLSIQEILEQAKNGMPLEERINNYFDAGDLEKINHLFKAGIDLTELDELGQRVAHLTQSIEKAKAVRDSAEKEREPVFVPTEPNEE